jgi:hypothetical protein
MTDKKKSHEGMTSDQPTAAQKAAAKTAAKNAADCATAGGLWGSNKCT